MAYSSLWCRLNKVSFTFTMTSSKAKLEGGENKCEQPTLLKPEPTTLLLLTLQLTPAPDPF
jgi:hypothetical protein